MVPGRLHGGDEHRERPDLIAGNGLATVTDRLPRQAISTRRPIDASTGATGLITAGTDVDVMRLTHPGGAFELRVQPDAGHGNLDVEAALLDATGALISGPTVGAVLVQATNPATEGSAGRSHGLASRLSAASLPAGTYHLTVRGSGAPATSTPYANLAYSSYGSLGRYVVTTRRGRSVVSLVPWPRARSWTRPRPWRRRCAGAGRVADLCRGRLRTRRALRPRPS